VATLLLLLVVLNKAEPSRAPSTLLAWVPGLAEVLMPTPAVVDRGMGMAWALAAVGTFYVGAGKEVKEDQ
jgi:hypothetical protein